MSSRSPRFAERLQRPLRAPRASARALDALDRLLPDLYTSRPLDRFLRDAAALLMPLIPADGSGWLIAPGAGRQRLANRPDVAPGMVEALAARLSADLHDALTGSPRVLRFFGHDHLTIPVPRHDSGICAFGYHRARGGFTADHRLLAEHLRPHLSRAFANAMVFSSLSERTAPSAVATGVLTTRESQVMFWVARGKTNREIGLILQMGLRTVEKHVEHALRKLGAENRTTAALALAESARDATQVEAGVVAPAAPV